MSNNTSNSGPPTFPEDQQFDGTNFVHFKNRVLIAAQAHGAKGYLEGTISKPGARNPAAPIKSETSETSSWFSENPSADDWDLRDAWTLGLIVYNCKNPVGLGVKMDGTAAEAWKSLIKAYGVMSKLVAMGAENAL
ncbi:hypothetical protein C0993_005814 [Termitomyces sp. T159_Od127]|nr:hypothetical protein C0993_005814 [Termitomyces sp. T159_Od127]